MLVSVLVHIRADSRYAGVSLLNAAKLVAKVSPRRPIGYSDNGVRGIVHSQPPSSHLIP